MNERICTPPLEGLRRGGLMGGVRRNERICTPLWRASGGVGSWGE
jgi:hypothetical protein